jgi:hypothetical protein
VLPCDGFTPFGAHFVGSRRAALQSSEAAQLDRRRILIFGRLLDN